MVATVAFRSLPPKVARRTCIAGAAVALSALAVGCGSSSSSSSPSSASGTSSSSGQAAISHKCTARMLFVTNLTGAASENGTANLPAVKLAVATVNQSGGVDGCTLALDVRNEASDPTQDVPIVEQATSQHHYADVLISDLGATSTVPYLMRQKILMVTNDCTGIAAHPATVPTMFDICPGEVLPVAAATDAAIKAGYKKIGAVVQANALGVEQIAGIQAAAKQLGASVVNVEQVDPTAVDTTPAITRLQDSGAQAVVVDLFGTVLGHFLDNLATTGWKVPLYGGLGAFSTNVASLVKPQEYKSFLIVGPSPATYPSTPSVVKFIGDLRQAPGGQASLAQNLTLSTGVYSAVIIFAWAANQTHSLDSGVLTKFLATHGSTPVPGLLIGQTTGYTPADHVFSGVDDLAIADAGSLNVGRLKRVAYVP